jgi:DMSO/TMAO reductase YedYZ heme-binding membrane subunit
MSGRYKIIVILFVAVLTFCFSARFALALVKDSDVDGLSDDAEIQQYHTNPQMFDTDNDGRGDGDEILDSTDPLDKESSRIATLSAPDPGIFGSPQKFAWYLGRASGILAFILLSGVVIFGLIISSRAFIKVVPGAVAYEVHRFIAWLALATIILHFSSFFFDDFLRLRIVEVLVPFMLSRELKTVLGFEVGNAAALGITAFYLVIILVLTSEFRAKISAKVWRRIHYISFIAYFLFVLHGFMSGTDSQTWWMRSLYSISVSLVILLVLVRIVFRTLVPKWRAWRLRQKTDTDVASFER